MLQSGHRASRLIEGRLDPDSHNSSHRCSQQYTILSAVLYSFPWNDTVSGDLSICPIAAPFERLARAQSVATAEQFEARITTAATPF